MNKFNSGMQKRNAICLLNLLALISRGDSRKDDNGRGSDGWGSAGQPGVGYPGWGTNGQPGWGTNGQPGWGSYGWGTYGQPGWGSNGQPGWGSNGQSGWTSSFSSHKGDGYNSNPKYWNIQTQYSPTGTSWTHRMKRSPKQNPNRSQSPVQPPVTIDKSRLKNKESTFDVHSKRVYISKIKW